ncbi:MAG: hypothetical protein K0Q67_2610 [Cellvibrio sp.]|nr:hypothetical protein [Cellvibrio sp.]
MNSTIEILNEVTHREIKIDFNEARNSSRRVPLLPVVMSEFHSLMFHYPIVMVKDKETGEFVCSVLLGINSEASLLDGKDMTNDEILPLNIRRLPLLAIAPSDGGARPLIALNMASPGVGQGDCIFKGKSTAFESAIFSLGELYDGYDETRAYVKELIELDLVSKLHAEIRHPDKPADILEGLYAIDLNKIAQLAERDETSKDKFLAISSFVYAQQFSLFNMKKMAPLIS